MSALAILREPVSDGPFCGPPETTRRSALHHAIFSLALSRPAFSARSVATTRQLTVLRTSAITVAIALLLWPGAAASAIVALMSIGFLFSAAFRMVLAWLDAPAMAVRASTPDEALPTYTILLPLHHEAGMLAQLAAAMAALDYPKDKLDLIFVVEEDDDETRAAAEAMGLRQIIVVPCAKPRTKPKACNYALQFASGEYLVVYDAEDRPEPNQLRKAIEAFRAAPDVACFQARLSIANDRGWLRGLFALDYAIWFETLLPGLARLRAPIPLGGTSNHFRMASLVAAGAWDPFNVTEDADLGLRLARLGYRVSMLDSSTLEDAPRHFCTWLRQRTRWMKGYMQTMLVHTRDPGDLVRGVGLRGCLVIQAFLGGAVWSALVNPLLWVLFIAGCLRCNADAGSLHVFAWISGSALLAANAVLAVLSFVASRRRAAVLACGLSYPIYWLLISIAAYRALWQLMRDPFRWEKTPHGEAECAKG